MCYCAQVWPQPSVLLIQMSLLRIKEGQPMSVGDIVANVEQVDDKVWHIADGLLRYLCSCLYIAPYMVHWVPIVQVAQAGALTVHWPAVVLHVLSTPSSCKHACWSAVLQMVKVLCCSCSSTVQICKVYHRPTCAPLIVLLCVLNSTFVCCSAGWCVICKVFWRSCIWHWSTRASTK